ncbi:MAG: Sec-independent protein translocase TatC [Frankiales bacterium]|nr:Sec-independent protein translocase TatC [Frankiales bacterium]
MPVVAHLLELRRRLTRSVLAIGLVMVVAFVLWEPIFTFLKQPYCDTEAGAQDCSLYALGIFDQFGVRIRVAAIAGVVLSAPVWLYQLGAFITPALHRHERRYALGFLGAATVFFTAGVAFAYLTVARGLDFLLQIGGGSITTLVSVKDYLHFLTLCLLAFGIAFQFPVVVMFLHLAGVLSSQCMRARRRGAIVAVFAASAVLTPSQDPITFCVMAVPLCLLYEVCILIARVRERRRPAPQLDLDDELPSPLHL